MDENAIAGAIVDAAIKVHTKLGAGLLEGAYQACLAYEIGKRDLSVKQQVPMPVCYDDVVLDIGYRIDLLVNDAVVVELKSVERVLPLHSAQLLSYLRLGHYHLGLLLNFNTVHMRDGIKRVINGYYVPSAPKQNIS
jgi:GxxExxY protein